MRRRRRARKNPVSTILPLVVTAGAAVAGGLVGRLELDKTIQNISNWPAGHILTSGDPIWQEYVAGGVALGTGVAALGSVVVAASASDEGTRDGSIVAMFACTSLAILAGVWWYRTRMTVQSGQPAELPATPAVQQPAQVTA